MARIGFSIDEIIAELEKNKEKDQKDRQDPPKAKIQRHGPGHFEFYLHNPAR